MYFKGWSDRVTFSYVSQPLSYGDMCKLLPDLDISVTKS